MGSSVPRCLPTMPSAAVRSRCDGSRRDSAPVGSQPTDSPAGVPRKPTPHLCPSREFGGLSLLARSYARRLACRSSFPRLYRGSQCMSAAYDARACVTRWTKCRRTNGRCGLRAAPCEKDVPLVYPIVMMTYSARPYTSSTARSARASDLGRAASSPTNSRRNAFGQK